MNRPQLNFEKLSIKSLPLIPSILGWMLCGLIWELIPAPAYSQVISWNNTTGSPDPWFDVSGNWVGGVRPGTSGEARFDQNANYEVWWDGFTASVVPEVRRLWTLAGQVTLSNRNSLTPHRLDINESASGGVVGMLVSGPATTLTVQGLHLAASDNGVNIADGGTLNLRRGSVFGASGSVLSTSGTLNLFTGTLNNTSGTIFSQAGVVGRHVGNNGFADIYGQQASWTVDEHLIVGHQGAGALLADLGATITSQTGEIGFSSGSLGEVTVKTNTENPSQWNMTGQLRVGRAGQGILNIEDGSLVSSGSAVIGFLSDSVGQVNVVDENSFTSARSQWEIAGNLIVGQAGVGRLAVTDRGLVTVGGNLTIGSQGEVNFQQSGVIHSPEIEAPKIEALGGWHNSGVIKVDGGWGILRGHVTMAPGGMLQTGSTGTTLLADGLRHNGLDIDTAAGRRLYVAGRWDGAGHFSGAGEVVFSHELHPGNSASVINFGGNVFLNSNSHTFIELGGLAWGEYDRLEIQGDLGIINSQLSVNLIDGFELGLNQEFLIFNVSGGLLGQFDSLGEGSLVGNFGGIDLFITYHAGSGNSVALFTAIPEPRSRMMLVMVSTLIFLKRSQRNHEKI